MIGFFSIRKDEPIPKLHQKFYDRNIAYIASTNLHQSLITSSHNRPLNRYYFQAEITLESKDEQIIFAVVPLKQYSDEEIKKYFLLL